MDFTHILHSVPARDWVIISLLLLGIILLISLSELIRRFLQWPVEFTRKLVHILVGILMFFSPILLETSLPLIIISLFFTIVNFTAMKKGLLKGMHGERETFGTTFYPLSFLILVLFAWQEYKIIIIGSMMILAIGDASAAIVGETLRQPRKYILITEQKSFQGSVTMFFVSFIVLFLTLKFYLFNGNSPIISNNNALWIASVTAIIATAAEALSTKGSDNLSIPIFSAVILYFMINQSFDGNLQLTIGLLLAFGVSVASFYLNFLDKSGAIATFLLATIIFGFGGWKWSIPILVFFILSSLLSKAGKKIKTGANQFFSKGSQRDYAQVLANGGTAGFIMILYMFYEIPQFYFFYLASIAAAMADTWATEIGTLAKQQPRLISTLKKVPTGTSGGITILGFVGSILGAFILAMSGLIFFPNNTSLIQILLSITISGTLASLLDSYLGATVQVQYTCAVCNKITERQFHCSTETSPTSGIKWISNDLINFINTISGIVFLYIGIKIFFNFNY